MEKDSVDNLVKSIRYINEMQENCDYDEEKVKKQLNNLNLIFKDVTRQSLFSPNESFDEIHSENLKFLLIPFYQGELIFLLQDREKREKNLKLVLQFYEEFFKILKNYEFIDKEQIDLYNSMYLEALSASSKGKENADQVDKLIEQEKKKETPKRHDLEMMSKDRETKIKEYKQKKELLERIKFAEKRNEDDTRDYWVDYLNMSWKKMLENLRSFKMEFESIAFFENMKKNGKYNDFSKPNTSKQNKKLESLKITPENMKTLNSENKLLNNVMFGDDKCGPCTNINNVIENKLNFKDTVFRNRNPTTMTLDEFADKQIEYMAQGKEMEEQSKIRQQKEEDLSDADEEVDDRRKQEKRAWDDWRDLNQKGGGNKGGK